MPLLWHRRLSTPVRETLLLSGRGRGALHQQLPTLAHQGLGDTLSSAPTLACEQQCRGLALQLANRSLRCLLRRWRVLAPRLAALHIGNPRRKTLLGRAKDLLFGVLHRSGRHRGTQLLVWHVRVKPSDPLVVQTGC